MQDRNYDGYYIVWFDSDMQPIDADAWIDKATHLNAVRSAALRLRQSPHMVPESAVGFCVITPQRWRIHKGMEIKPEDLTQKLAEIPKLSKEEFDKLQDELSKKYGPPPNDDDED